MIRIVSIPMKYSLQEEAIKKWGITKNNLIAVMPVLTGDIIPERVIVTFDNGESEDA